MYHRREWLDALGAMLLFGRVGRSKMHDYQKRIIDEFNELKIRNNPF
jgi:hypothetical protein